METELITNAPDTAPQFEALKLCKMSKGYNWEIKIFLKQNITDLDSMDRLEQLNNEMNKRFGIITI